MGSDVADLNNDGYAEIFTTEMLPPDNHRIKTMTKFQESNIEELRVRSSYHYQLMQNSLHYNDGDANFQELAFLTNTAATDWSWGGLFFDFNNDGWEDVYVGNDFHENDYYYLHLEPWASNNALPIIDGKVRDLNHVWSDQDLLPYRDWRSRFLSIRSTILSAEG